MKAMQARGPAKIFKLQVLQVNSHKLLPVQQDLQMLYLPVHPLYCQPGAEDLQILRRLWTCGEEKKLHVSQSQYHGYWCAGSVRGQGISMRVCMLHLLMQNILRVFTRNLKNGVLGPNSFWRIVYCLPFLARSLVMNVIIKTHLKITHLKSKPHPPGDNELKLIDQLWNNCHVFSIQYKYMPIISL